MKKQLQDDNVYFNSDGLMVFTSAYLLERGYCCGNGCMHCPYEYKQVPEPKRGKLIAERLDRTSREQSTERNEK